MWANRRRCWVPATVRGVAELVELSKAVARVLRHRPWAYEIELDEAGWTPVEDLREALGRSSSRWHDIQTADLEEMIARSSKRRYEISGARIRALYGHSLPGRIAVTPAVPPATLFHGTSVTAAVAILAGGLVPMRRQYVHLSVEVEMARQVGRRKGPEPVILTVAAGDASAAGVVFYHGNEMVWLADRVPPEFIAGPG
jgi:putative RNA 2'-phosphotransferase